MTQCAVYLPSASHPLPCPRPLQKGEARARLALSDLNSPSIYIYDIKSGSNDPVATLDSLHRAPVTALKYNPTFDTVISADTKVRSTACTWVSLGHAHSPGLGHALSPG